MNTGSNVIELDLNPVRAKKIITEVLGYSERVFFTTHSENRMKQRKITRTQVFRCLKRGHFSENPTRSPNGSWKFTIETFSAGENISVTAALDNKGAGNYIIVITVFNH